MKEFRVNCPAAPRVVRVSRDPGGDKSTGKENSSIEICTIRSGQQAADSAFLLLLPTPMLPGGGGRREDEYCGTS